MTTPSDDLSRVLEAVRLRGQLVCRLEARAPWAMSAPGSARATFHGVVQGDAVLRIAGERDVPLARGDLVVLCHGSGHVIADASATPAIPFREVLASAEGSWLVRCGGRGAQSVLACGGFSIEDDGPPLLALMPMVMHVRANPRVAALLSLIAAEGALRSAGGTALVARLTEALFVEVARDWVSRADAREHASIGALADKRIATALASIHRAPSRTWTVDALARGAGMSRSAFAATFAQRVGAPPLSYVASFRLHLAKALLRDSALGIAEVAQRTGYESEASLGKAFKQRFGVPPGAYRRSVAT